MCGGGGYCLGCLRRLQVVEWWVLRERWLRQAYVFVLSTFIPQDYLLWNYPEGPDLYTIKCSHRKLWLILALPGFVIGAARKE